LLLLLLTVGKPLEALAVLLALLDSIVEPVGEIIPLAICGLEDIILGNVEFDGDDDDVNGLVKEVVVGETVAVFIVVTVRVCTNVSFEL
jgi:hypothetical protein